MLSEAGLLAFGSEILPEPENALFVNEARFSLSRILPTLERRPSASVIEIGAGACILSAYLARNGVRITAVEPIPADFDFFTELQDRVLNYCCRNGIEFELLRIGAESLAVPESFDFAFTVNSLEHMESPLLALDNMYASLRPSGTLLGMCPNYSIPIEPHLRFILVTRSKAINQLVYRKAIAAKRDVWDALNFIRYTDLRRHFKRRGWRHSFNPSITLDMIRRAEHDPFFSARVPSFVRSGARALDRSGLLKLWPARLQSPMEFTVFK